MKVIIRDNIVEQMNKEIILSIENYKVIEKFMLTRSEYEELRYFMGVGFRNYFKGIPVYIYEENN